MKATIYQGNKTFSVIEKEIEAPAKGEVRIKVAYSGVCGTDVHIYHGMMDKRVSIPVTIGHEMSGTIDAIGDAVSGFQVGEKVVVRPLDNRAETEAFVVEIVSAANTECIFLAFGITFDLAHGDAGCAGIKGSPVGEIAPAHTADSVQVTIFIVVVGAVDREGIAIHVHTATIAVEDSLVVGVANGATYYELVGKAIVRTSGETFCVEIKAEFVTG